MPARDATGRRQRGTRVVALEVMPVGTREIVAGRMVELKAVRRIILMSGTLIISRAIAIMIAIATAMVIVEVTTRAIAEMIDTETTTRAAKLMRSMLPHERAGAEAVMVGMAAAELAIMGTTRKAAPLHLPPLRKLRRKLPQTTLNQMEPMRMRLFILIGSLIWS